MQPELKGSRAPSTRDSLISSTGALVSFSGLKTGRTPGDKRVVLDEVTEKVSLKQINISRIFGGVM